MPLPAGIDWQGRRAFGLGGSGELDVFDADFAVFGVVFLLEVHFAGELYGANFPTVFTKSVYQVGILFVEVELYGLGSFGAFPVSNLEGQGGLHGHW